MLTIAESTYFSAIWPNYWTEDELGEFCAWLAVNPQAGAVIRGTGGCRKVRWGRAGQGKRGGLRVIYLAELPQGKLWLLTMFSKNVLADVERKFLNRLREMIRG